MSKKERDKIMRIRNISIAKFWEYQNSLKYNDIINDEGNIIQVYNSEQKLVTEYDKVRHMLKIY